MTLIPTLQKHDSLTLWLQWSWKLLVQNTDPNQKKEITHPPAFLLYVAPKIFHTADGSDIPKKPPGMYPKPWKEWERAKTTNLNWWIAGFLNHQQYYKGNHSKLPCAVFDPQKDWVISWHDSSLLQDDWDFRIFHHDAEWGWDWPTNFAYQVGAATFWGGGWGSGGGSTNSKEHGSKEKGCGCPTTSWIF